MTAPPRWQLGLGLIALVALHVTTRVRHAAEVFGSSEQQPLLAATDSFCHAHRTQILFEQFPKWVFHDRFMFHPTGTILEWPLGYDWTAAAVLRVFSTSWDTAVWWLPFTSVAISVLALLVFLAVAGERVSAPTSLLLAGCFSLNPAFARTSTLAELDHHVVETLCVTSLMWLPSLLGLASRAPAMAFGVALAWMIWNSTLLAFVVFAFFSAWALAVLLHPKRVTLPRHLAAFAIALLLPLLTLCFVEAHARADYLAFSTLSLLHFALVALSLLMLAVAPRLSWKQAAGSALVALSITAAVVPDFFGWIAGFVAVTDPMIANINEARPLFTDLHGFTWTYAHWFFGPTYVLFPVALISLWRTDRNDERGGQWVVILLFTAGVFLLSLSQKRFAHLFAPGLVLVVGVWATRLWRPKLALCVVTLMFVEPAAAFFSETRFAVSDGSRTSIRVAHVLRDAAGGRDDLGVSAPPNFGSAINYAAGLPVVTSAFFYPKYMQADLTLRSFEATADLLAHLRQQRLGFLVVVDDVRYRTMLLKSLGHQEEAAQAATWERAPCAGPLLRYAYDRIACGIETPPELSLLSHERVSNDPRRLWRELRAFQLR